MTFICYKLILVYFYLQLCILLLLFFCFVLFCFIFTKQFHQSTCARNFQISSSFSPAVSGTESSCINDCVTCLYQFPDAANVSDPAEDYTLSLHQHFSIHPAACVSKLHLKEIFAKTILAASVTNALFELCSDVIKGCQNLLQAVHFGDGPPYNTLVKVTQ